MDTNNKFEELYKTLLNKIPTKIEDITSENINAYYVGLSSLHSGQIMKAILELNQKKSMHFMDLMMFYGPMTYNIMLRNDYIMMGMVENHMILGPTGRMVIERRTNQATMRENLKATGLDDTVIEELVLGKTNLQDEKAIDKFMDYLTKKPDANKPV